MSLFPGLCRNVTAQSHLDLKVWSCHTLWNELLGTASVSLSSLLKSGGKCTYELDPTGALQPLSWLRSMWVLPHPLPMGVWWEERWWPQQLLCCPLPQEGMRCRCGLPVRAGV